MSNRLYITLTEFTPLIEGAESTFGFRVADDYAKDYEDHWDSLEEFFKEYPTEESLKDHVFDLEGFQDIDPTDPDNVIGVSSVVVDGY